LQGCLTGTVAAATVLVAAEAPVSSLATRLGLLQTAVFCGNSIGPAFGGMIADATDNRVSFLVTSACLLTAGLIVFFTVRESFKRPEAPMARDQGPRIKSMKAAIPITMFSLLGVVFMFQCSNSIIMPILPMYLESIMKNGNFVRSLSGVVIGVASVTSALSAAAVGKLSDRFGHVRLLVICLSLAAVDCFLQGVFPAVPVLVALRAAEGLCLGGTMPAVNALIATRSPKERQGSLFGLSTSVGQIGAALGPMIGSMAATLFGFSAVFFVSALMLAAVVGSLGLFARKTRSVA
jgi:DHA1 family multidrug resistance protein-like MFS transporter